MNTGSDQSRQVRRSSTSRQRSDCDFQPFPSDSDDAYGPHRYRLLMRVWIGLLITSILLLVGICMFALQKTHEKKGNHMEPVLKLPQIPGDRRRNKNEITFVNFNAEWLFMRGGKGSIRCPSESCPWANKKEARDHLKKVAGVVAELDADIVNLNEVEDCNVLHDLLEFLPANHGYKFYMIQGEDSATGQNPAILTRIDPDINLMHSNTRLDFPVDGTKCPASIFGSTGCTKHYLTRFRPKNEAGIEAPFLLSGFHFLSRPLDKLRCARREAQATIIAELVYNYQKEDDRVILAGDLNDYDSETPGPNGERSISGVVSILKTRLGLVNAAQTVPRRERYSCWFDKDQNCRDDGQQEHTLIDHVLVSREWTVRYAKFHHNYKVSCQERVSDHWPFKVTLDIK